MPEGDMSGLFHVFCSLKPTVAAKRPGANGIGSCRTDLQARFKWEILGGLMEKGGKSHFLDPESRSC